LYIEEALCDSIHLFVSFQVSTVDEFIQQLQCEPDAKVKVVTIFGKTGEGKSYTLNHTFFDGCEVFSTEQQDFSSMATCTNGIWAAFDPVHEIVLFDTEGWQGTSATEQLHMRHLFKVSLLMLLVGCCTFIVALDFLTPLNLGNL
jgi:zinc finger FYVE domain-containing protein 1